MSETTIAYETKAVTCELSDLAKYETDGWYFWGYSQDVATFHRDIDIEALITAARQDEREKIKGWIERNHLGKGLDGYDRWEHCAAEIIDHIDRLTPRKEDIT